MKQTLHKTAGFSMIELLVVLALCAIVCMVTLANLSFFDRLLVHAEAEKLFLTCCMLQQHAMSNNSSIELTFDPQKHSYRYNHTIERLPRTVRFGFIPGTKGPPAKPARKLSQAITFINQQIIFYPDGIIKPGSVYLVSNDRQIMYAISSPVSQVSFLRLYRYDKKWECLS